MLCAAMARRPSEVDRIVSLIALDADALVKRLAERKDEMVAMFSRHREREPLLSPLRSWVPSASFQEIVLLSPALQAAVSGFYEELDALRWYFRYTNDMPGTAQQVFAHHLRKLEAAHARLVEALGPARVPGARSVKPRTPRRKRSK